MTGAPEVTIATCTRGLPRRIERQIRASWIRVPALRNLFFRRTLLESANIAYRSNVTALEDSDAHGKELVAATQDIYCHLQSGAYLNWRNKERPIAGDLSKVSCVTTLSAKGEDPSCEHASRVVSAMWRS